MLHCHSEIREIISNTHLRIRPSSPIYYSSPSVVLASLFDLNKHLRPFHNTQAADPRALSMIFINEVTTILRCKQFKEYSRPYEPQATSRGFSPIPAQGNLFFRLLRTFCEHKSISSSQFIQFCYFKPCFVVK